MSDKSGNQYPRVYLWAAVIVFCVLMFASMCSKAEATPQVDENGGMSEARSVRIDVEAGYTVFRASAPQVGLTLSFEDLVPAPILGRLDLQVGIGYIAPYEYKGELGEEQRYVQSLLVWSFGRLDLGAGGVYLDHNDRINGSNANFSLLAAVRFGQNNLWKASLRHFSNAGTKMPNLGRDILILTRSF